MQKEGLKITSAGTADYRRGDKIRPALAGTIDETFKVPYIYNTEAHSSPLGGVGSSHVIKRL
jgi:hypothetical protein